MGLALCYNYISRYAGKQTYSDWGAHGKSHLTKASLIWTVRAVRYHTTIEQVDFDKYTKEEEEGISN